MSHYKLIVAENNELQEQVLARFRELFLTAGEPDGAALYGLFSPANGHMTDMFLNAVAVEHFPQLLEEFPGWDEFKPPPPIGTNWLAGDPRLNNYPASP
ncbi:MAG TPA: hypothetical protein VEX60_14510 [Pyrinomonadaceae bacterium]|nr:hypothetical protein [Pyrinomonadaceae bacterium]